MEKRGGKITLRSENICAVFRRGWLCSLDFGDGELMAQRTKKRAGLRPNYFRALVDNDMGYTNFVPPLSRAHFLRLWNVASQHVWAVWARAQRLSPGSVRLRVYWAEPTGLAPFPLQRTTCTVHAGGVIEVAHKARGILLPMLRAGLRLRLDHALGHAAWYGRGPYESYCDRKTGQRIAAHECPVKELEHRYMRPQENGNRTDVRSLALTREDGAGILFEAGTAFGFSALNYSQEALDKARHQGELWDDGCLHLSIDAFQRGVGGDLPGCACLHEPYKMPPGRYELKFQIKSANTKPGV